MYIYIYIHIYIYSIHYPMVTIEIFFYGKSHRSKWLIWGYPYFRKPPFVGIPMDWWKGKSLRRKPMVFAVKYDRVSGVNFPIIQFRECTSKMAFSYGTWSESIGIRVPYSLTNASSHSRWTRAWKLTSLTVSLPWSCAVPEKSSAGSHPCWKAKLDGHLEVSSSSWG